MSVRRIQSGRLDKVPSPDVYDALSASSASSDPYRIWIGAVPPQDSWRTGNIWINPSIVPNQWKMFYPDGTWYNMLADATSHGLMAAGDYSYLASLKSANPTVGAYLRTDTTANQSVLSTTTTFRRIRTTVWLDVGTDATVGQRITAGTSLNTGTFAAIGSYLTVGTDATVTKNMRVGAALNVGGSATITSTCTAQSFNSTSSRAYKTNIVPSVMDAIGFLNKISVVEFRWASDLASQSTRIGFIAEDTDPLVSGDNKNTMDHANLLGVLIKANQELSAKVAALEAQVTELKNG